MLAKYLLIQQIDVHSAFIILYTTQESRIQVTEILLTLAQVNMGTCWLISQQVQGKWLQAQQTPGGPSVLLGICLYLLTLFCLCWPHFLVMNLGARESSFCWKYMDSKVQDEWDELKENENTWWDGKNNRWSSLYHDVGCKFRASLTFVFPVSIPGWGI